MRSWVDVPDRHSPEQSTYNANNCGYKSKNPEGGYW